MIYASSVLSKAELLFYFIGHSLYDIMYFLKLKQFKQVAIVLNCARTQFSIFYLDKLGRRDQIIFYMNP